MKKKIKEKKTGETYSSKKAMKKHEGKESKKEQKAEMKKPMMKNGGTKKKC